MIKQLHFIVFYSNRKHYNEHMAVNGSFEYSRDDIVLYNYTDTISPEPKWHETFVLERGILTVCTSYYTMY